MIDWIDALIGLVIGAALGAIAATLWQMRRRSDEHHDLANLRARTDLQQQEAERHAGELQTLRGELAAAHELREAAQQQTTALTEQLKAREQEMAKERALLDEARAKLSDAFKAVGAEALAANNKQFLDLAAKTLEAQYAAAKGDVEKRQQAIDGLVKPIKELLEKHNAAVTEIEKKRDVAYKGLEEQIRMIAASHEKLDTQTGKLVSALRRPEQRGRWGEMQLRNVVETAGMTEHCDFHEQPQTDDPTTRDRPDMIVHMSDGGVIVVDSKVAMDAYLDALEPDADRAERIQAHARQVQDHVNRLAGKKYWDQFDHTPKLVVMFMPLEPALGAAYEVLPDLQSNAIKQHVFIATPSLLIAMLTAVAYGWHQEAAAANAKRITDVGKELYDRIRIFAEHFDKVGGGLKRASEFYNRAVGSLERNLLTSSRRLKELSATTDAEITPPDGVDIEIRPITSTELKQLPEELSAPGASGAPGT